MQHRPVLEVRLQRLLDLLPHLVQVEATLEHLELGEIQKRPRVAVVLRGYRGPEEGTAGLLRPIDVLVQSEQPPAPLREEGVCEL